MRSSSSAFTSQTKWLLAAVLCACTQSPIDSNISIEDQTGGCAAFSNLGTWQRQETVLLQLAVTNANAASDCLCKSALISYEVSQVIDGRPTALTNAVFSALEAKQITLPITTRDHLLADDAPITVVLSCANPL